MRFYFGFSPTSKTDRHDITEILLKVVLNTTTLPLVCVLYYNVYMSRFSSFVLVIAHVAPHGLLIGNKEFVLYCIVLYCIVLYCIALHCIALHCIALHCIVLYCIVLYCIVLYCIVLYQRTVVSVIWHYENPTKT
jgi:hypothetical protein